MDIEKVIHASNDEPFYLDFWEVVSKVWRQKFGVTPILLYFGNSKINEQYGSVIKMKVVEDLPVSLCCQLSRYWYPVVEKDAVFMTSDIDMIPISTWYFKDQIKDISDDKFVNLNPYKKEEDKEDFYPCCYNVAKGSTFKEILDLQNNWENFVNNNVNHWTNIVANHQPQGLNKSFTNWTADEVWSTKKIRSFDQNRIIKMPRKQGTDYMRINRSCWSWSEDLINDYYDCHCLRPYSSHKKEIDRLVEVILR
jgi:hypothetical protein